MSKSDDRISSGASEATPLPVPTDGYRMERSGSIAISSTDFSTPGVRKRTTTRPRGLPAVGTTVVQANPTPPPAAVDEADIPTPPPRVNGAAALDGAPLEAAEELAVPVAEPPPVPSFEPPPAASFEPAPEPTLHDQASRLRDAELMQSAADQVTPPPAPGTMQAPALEAEPDPGPTPPPELAPEPIVDDGDGDVPPTPPPVPEPMLAAPPVVEEPPIAEAADASADEDATPAPAGAVPASSMQDTDSERNLSPLAHTLANLAESKRQSDSGRDGEEGEDELDLMDAPLDAAPVGPVATARPSAMPPALPAAALMVTPPPIPGSQLKTPRPEPRRPDAKADGEAGADGRPGIPPFPVPEALAQRPRRPKRSKPWFEEVFDEDYLRTLPSMTPQQTLREVSFIEESLKPAPAAELLDIGCGYGRHAIELVQRGFSVTGLDLSLPLLLRAADEAQKRALSVNFVHADMREMPFDKKFDGAYCMLTSFGYFDEESNLRVAEGIARALKPGGRFLLDIVNRDYVVNDLPTRIWWEGVGCVVLEEVDFNFHTSRIVTRRSIVFEDGRQLEHEISVRAYSLHELGRLLRQAGFRVLDISGSMATRGRFFGSTSRNLFILSEKRSE